MNKLFAIMRREFIERVRTKAFIIGTLIVPIMSFVFGYLPGVLMNQDTRARSIVLVDGGSGAAGDSIATALRRMKRGTGAEETDRVILTVVQAKASEVDRVRDSLIAHVDVAAPGGLDGILVLTEGAVDSGVVHYYGANVASFKEMDALKDAIGPVLRVERLIRRGADSSMVAAAATNFDFQKDKVTKGRLTGESGTSSFFLAYITSLVMYISLIMYGIQVMGAVLEEKSNRIVEVLISSVTPFQLLMGKVLGVAGAGLLQLAIWAGAAAAGTSAMAHRSAIAATAADGTRQSFGGGVSVSPELVAVILIFFLLGFLLYSALYAAVGSMCSTQQETQQAAQPVTIILALGFLMMFALINDPGSTLARTVSFIPFFAPLVVPVRYAISPLPFLEVLGAALSTLIGVIAIVWFAGRIYRVGILSYGKKPSLKEVWGWVRTS